MAVAVELFSVSSDSDRPRGHTEVNRRDGGGQLHARNTSKRSGEQARCNGLGWSRGMMSANEDADSWPFATMKLRSSLTYLNTLSLVTCQ